MHIFDPFLVFLVSCRMDSVRSPHGLSPGEHLVSINLDLLGRSTGARRTKSGNLQLHSSPFAATTLCQKIRLLQCLELSMNQHSHWNIWSRVCVPSSNLGSCAPYFPLKMSWHRPEATARVLGEVGGLHFCAWSKFKFTHTKNLDIRGTRAEYLLLTTSHKYVLKKCKERLSYLWRHLSLVEQGIARRLLGEVGLAVSHLKPTIMELWYLSSVFCALFYTWLQTSKTNDSSHLQIRTARNAPRVASNFQRF